MKVYLVRYGNTDSLDNKINQKPDTRLTNADRRDYREKF